MLYTFSHYCLTTHLAHKPDCDVYLAYPINEPGHFVVLKMFNAERLAPTANEDSIHQLETRLRRLTHPHIVPVLELSLDQGKPYIVSEYVNGGSLRHYMHLRDTKHLMLDEAVEIVTQVGQAVAFAHAQGITHQRIRPENVLLNDPGDALLTDFHLSTIIDEPETDQHTNSYLAPEQLLGSPGFLSDQYALGCLLHELITGTLPDLPALWEQATPSPTKSPSLMAAVETVTARALAMKPEDRYPDVPTFLQALEDADHPEPPAFPFARLTAGQQHNQPGPKPAQAQGVQVPTPPAAVRSTTQRFQEDLLDGIDAISGLDEENPDRQSPRSPYDTPEDEQEDALFLPSTGQGENRQAVTETGEEEEAFDPQLAFNLPIHEPVSLSPETPASESAFAPPAHDQFDQGPPSWDDDSSMLGQDIFYAQPTTSSNTQSVPDSRQVAPVAAQVAPPQTLIAIPGQRRPLVLLGIALALTLLATLLASSFNNSVAATVKKAPTLIAAKNTPKVQPTSRPLPTPTLPPTPRPKPTPTPKATPKPKPKPKPTPTPRPLPTSTPIPVPTPTPSFYVRATSGPPVYYSAMAGPDAGHWDILGAGGTGCSYAHGVYQVANSITNSYLPCYANNLTGSDFTFQFRMAVNPASNNGGGVIFRHTNNAEYRLRIGTDGSYDLVTPARTLLSGSSAAFYEGAGQSNTITIIAHGSNIYIYVNAQQIAYISDTSSTSGTFGFFAVDFSHATTALFSDVELW